MSIMIKQKLKKKQLHIAIICYIYVDSTHGA